MSTTGGLAEFQKAAVDHIVRRFKDRRGSHRFLLADEVGLGKTVVARGVIDALSKRRRSPLVVVYLCSNAEIAEQNRSKLAEKGGTSVSRVTDLALQRPDANSRVNLYAFTPGTSLNGGTGMARERRLLLFLLQRLTSLELKSRRARNFFRCGAGLDRWLADTRPEKLRDEFLGRVSQAFQAAFNSSIRAPVIEGISLLKQLEEDLEVFDENVPTTRTARNKLVGKFREVMQRVALQGIEADLVILDEVQRFKDVIDEAENKDRIASELFGHSTPVLILSATPYRAFTTEHEESERVGSHHEDFFRTLDFLFGRDRKTPRRVRDNLQEFGRLLPLTDLQVPRDARLLELKRAIENDLLSVMCRTERNWYMAEGGRALSEKTDGEVALPSRAELKEFFDIHQGLAPHLDGVGLVTDFWKSAPSLLTFMDASYALMRKLRESRAKVPRDLLTEAGDPSLPDRNLRMRRLIEHSLGASDGPKLWSRPSYTYHRDEVYGHSGPRKMLVFSGWRFVPKAVSIVVSHAAATRLRTERAEGRQPLRFTDKGAFHVFDVCYPSWALATLINPRDSLSPEAIERPSTEVLKAVVATLREALRKHDIAVSSTGTAPVWQVLARLESATGFGGLAKTMIHKAAATADDAGTAEKHHRSEMIRWLGNETARICISERDLKRLALVAIASPAICLLRALLSVYPQDEVRNAAPALYALCLNELRTYFNRPPIQQAIRNHVPRGQYRRRRGRSKTGFAERALAYSLDHHLQAVLDEHTFLLQRGGAHPSVPGVIGHYKGVWSLGRGSRRTNRASGRGERVSVSTDARTWPTHFALAFGDETEEGAGPSATGAKPLRRSEIREAFNSPFWPFVLATTSVGQEGLDFHLYCRDVFHWNLPYNPVDLEQREGRVNRRGCLAVRQSIARDVPLSAVADKLSDATVNPWTAIFEKLDAEPCNQSQKHGLYPHWIYECASPEDTVRIERHVAFFDTSQDSQRYEQLKVRLALYRLVFGQANQEHLLADLERQLEDLQPDQRTKAQRRLSGYMLKLSPIGAHEASQIARAEAQRLLDDEDGEGLRQLIDDTKRIIAVNEEELQVVHKELTKLISSLEDALRTDQRQSRNVRLAATALAYLRNPYDQHFDFRSAGGLDDDISIIRAMYKKCRW